MKEATGGVADPEYPIFRDTPEAIDVTSLIGVGMFDFFRMKRYQVEQRVLERSQPIKLWGVGYTV